MRGLFRLGVEVETGLRNGSGTIGDAHLPDILTDADARHLLTRHRVAVHGQPIGVRVDMIGMHIRTDLEVNVRTQHELDTALAAAFPAGPIDRATIDEPTGRWD